MLNNILLQGLMEIECILKVFDYINVTLYVGICWLDC